MQQRRLGKDGPLVSAIGLGCMGLTDYYGAPETGEVIDTIHRALDLGITLFDTGEFYSDGANEELLGRALAGRRDRAVIASKFGVVHGGSGGKGGSGHGGVDGSPEQVRRSCEGSLKRLGVSEIDLFVLARVDPDVPIEDTVGAMAALIDEGKVKHIGLSEAAEGTVRRANAVHQLAAVESEFSLWTRERLDDVLPVCEELDIGFLAFSPLGRGFFTGTLKNRGDLAADDRRNRFPRFSEENFDRNRPLAEKVEAIAAGKGCTPAQLALAWALAQGEGIVPIPGTKHVKYLEENAAAAEISLSAEDIAALASAVPTDAVIGDRYSAAGMKSLNR